MLLAIFALVVAAPACGIVTAWVVWRWQRWRASTVPTQEDFDAWLERLNANAAEGLRIRRYGNWARDRKAERQ